MHAIAFQRCEGDPAFEPEARKGSERADLVPSDFGCGVSRGCLAKIVAVTLPPGGTATMRGEYRAQRKKLLPSCLEQPVGPLAAGEYTLHMSTPLLFADAKSRRGYRAVEVPLRVGK